MNYNPVDNFVKTMDSAVRFLARDNHKNVAKLFHKTGYTCELETHKGTFFEAVVLNEQGGVAEVKIFWGISASREHTEEVNKYIELVNQYQEYICYSGIDSTGRIYSTTAISFEPCEISVDFFRCMEDACFSAIDMFLAALLIVNSGRNTAENAFRSVVKEEKLYSDPTLEERIWLMNLYLELKNKEDD